MIKNICQILLLLVASFAMSQRPTATLSSATILNCDSFLGLDNLGNYYYTTNNVLYKKTTNKTFQYKNIALNKISFVDFINPLKIVVFYENFNTCILLDAQFNEILQKNFTKDLKETIVSHLGLSANNKLWLFNSLTNEILLCDYKTNTSKTVGQPLTNSIVYAQSDFNTFYWIDDLNSCYSIDIFGKTNLLCTIPAYDSIQIIDNERILFSLNKKLYLLNNIKKSVIEIEIVENSFKNFYYKDQNLAIFTDQEIKNYKITLP